MKFLLTMLIALFCSLSLTAQERNLPAFSFMEDYPNANTEVTNETVPEGTLIVLFFDPDYPPCKAFAAGLEHDSLPPDVTMLWVSWNTAEENVAFAKAHPGFGEQHHFAHDHNYKIDSYFGHSEIPSMWIFNSAGKRIKMFYNMVPDRKGLWEALNRR